MKKILLTTLLAFFLTACTVAFFSCEVIEIDLEGATTQSLVDNNDDAKGESN